jgi:hypothetical protein
MAIALIASHRLNGTHKSSINEVITGESQAKGGMAEFMGF